MTKRCSVRHTSSALQPAASCETYLLGDCPISLGPEAISNGQRADLAGVAQGGGGITEVLHCQIVSDLASSA
jgi:hypothetical protein